jgi:GH3 auxin-responsive promoter
MTLNKIIDYRNQHPQLWLPRNRAEFERREVIRYEALVESGFINQLRDKSDTSVILRTGGTSSLAYKILPTSKHRFTYNDRAVSKQLLVDVALQLWPSFVLELLNGKVVFLPGNMFESGDVPTRYVSNALVSEKWWLWQWICPVPQEIFDGIDLSTGVKLFETSEQKLSAIALCYGGRSPAVVSWVPWVVLQFAKQWEKLYDTPLRPQVVIVWWCAIDPYVHQLRDVLWQDIVIIPYYNATEWTFGYQPHELWDSDDYQTLVLKHYCGIWYELIDPNEQIISLSDAKLDTRYRLLISTYDGLCRYELGDVIEVVDVEQSWIKIVGRTSEYIDIANEHTQIQHIQQTMSQLGEDYSIWPYCVFPSQDGAVWHYTLVAEMGWMTSSAKKAEEVEQQWIPEKGKEGEVAEKFDRILWQQNCNYAAKRSGGTLWSAQVRIVEQW